MKNLLLIMLLMLVSMTTALANRHQPLIPTQNLNDADYKIFLVNYMQSHKDYRGVFLMVINTALKDAGEKDQNGNILVYSEKDIPEIFKHITFSIKTLKDFWNTYRDSVTDEIMWYKDPVKTGRIGTFTFGNYATDVIKKDCSNLIMTPLVYLVAVVPIRPKLDEGKLNPVQEKGCTTIYNIVNNYTTINYPSSGQIRTGTSEPTNTQHIPHCGCCGEFHYADGYCARPCGQPANLNFVHIRAQFIPQIIPRVQQRPCPQPCPSPVPVCFRRR